MSQIINVYPQSRTTYYLPWNSLNQDYPPSCTSSECILQLCKVSSALVHPLRRSCTYKTDEGTAPFLYTQKNYIYWMPKETTTLLQFFIIYFQNNSVGTFGSKMFERHWLNFCKDYIVIETSRKHVFYNLSRMWDVSENHKITYLHVLLFLMKCFL